MRVLVFGAGVIGTVYAWQLSLAGHDVTLLVRPGRAQALKTAGVRITGVDERRRAHVRIDAT